jgi:nucleoside-diphosphate-sugar epimerase
MVSIDELVNITARVAGKEIEKVHITDSNAVGVRGRNSCNDLIREKLGWDYEQTLEEGIRKTYEWICDQNPKAVYDRENFPVDHQFNVRV